jgi:hypothetical protein
MKALLSSISSRVTTLERALSKGTPALPPRLGTAGQQVTDWNQATQPGFYWSDAGAVNQPIGDLAIGTVVVRGPVSPRIYQEIRYANSAARLNGPVWRRMWDGAAWSAWTVSMFTALWRDGGTAVVGTSAITLPFSTPLYGLPQATTPIFTVAGGVFTCTRAQEYTLSGAVYLGAASAAVSVLAQIVHNGAEAVSVNGRADALAGSSLVIPSVRRQVNVGDTLQLTVTRGTTGTVSTGGNSARTWFQISN